MSHYFLLSLFLFSKKKEIGSTSALREQQILHSFIIFEFRDLNHLNPMVLTIEIALTFQRDRRVDTIIIAKQLYLKS